MSVLQGLLVHVIYTDPLANLMKHPSLSPHLKFDSRICVFTHVG